MGSKRPRRYYCKCGSRLANDNSGRQCARCERASRDKLITPPEVPPEFWQTDRFQEAFAAQHMGRVSRVYRTHPYHYAVYGRDGVSQTLLGQWLGLCQAQVSRYETGPPLQFLDTLRHWAQVMRIPQELLWFRLSEGTTQVEVAEAAGNGPIVNDPVLATPWTHRGTVKAVVLLSVGGGGRVERRVFLALTGPALTAPAHHWLVQEPEAVVSGLAGGRVSAGVADKFPAMIAELRTMGDTAGGDTVLSLAQHHFGWVGGLLDQASYDDAVGRKLHIALAELGQLCSFSAFDAGNYGLAQRYHVAALRAAHTADDRPLGAHILGEMAYQAAHRDRPAEAVTLVDTALSGTRGRQTPRLLAQLYIQRAHGHAVLNDASACTTAISQARTHVERSGTGHDQPYLYWVRPAEVTSSAGECLLQLGPSDQAAALINEGIAMDADAPFNRDRQYYLTYLAEARARPGKQRDLEASAALAKQSIDLAAGLDSTLNIGRIRSLAHQLKPHATVPAVREFLDRAKELAKN